MEKRRRNSRSSIRRKYRNQKVTIKESVVSLLLKQLGISIFLFLLIMILQFIPSKSTNAFIQNINETVSYNMSLDEAVKTVKNTAAYIPVFKNWVEEDEVQKEKIQEDQGDQTEKNIEDSTVDIENSLSEKENLDQQNEVNTEQNEEDIIDDEPVSNTEDIFILEPDLGESQQTTAP